MHEPRNMRARGDVGEDFCVQFLIDHHCEILCRNYSAYSTRTNRGEIDIIAESEHFILFVEVKSRKIPYSPDAPRPAEAVTKSKQRHIMTAAAQWLRNEPHDPQKPLRFDVAEVYLTAGNPPAVLHFNYIPNAFVRS